MTPEDAASFEKTLELGKEIAKDLPDHDILSRWMAHHVSELIIRAETTTGDQADDIKREAVQVILELWSRRAGLTVPDPPMAASESVLTALARLSEEQNPWGFYRLFRTGHEPDDSDMASVPMLQMALTLEDHIRDVVRGIVAMAAKEAAEKDAKWLRLSEHLREDEQRSLLRSLGRLTRGAPAEAGPTQVLDAALRDAEKHIGILRSALSALTYGENVAADMPEDANERIALEEP